MASFIHEVTHLTPEEAARKRAYLETRIWYEQYVEVPFVKDPRPEYYLKNEIRAFWEGYIDEFRGWSNPIGQVADWVIDKVKEMLDDLWNATISPALAGVKNVLSSLINSVAGTVSDIWDKLVDVASSVSALYNALYSWIWDKLHATWAILSNIGSTIFQKASEAVQVVRSWLSEFVSNAVSVIKSTIKTYHELYKLALNSVQNTILDALGSVKDSLSSAWNDLTTFISGKFETVTQALSALPETVASGFQAAISYLKDILEAVWSDVVQPLGNAVKEGLEWVAGKMHDAFFTVMDSFENIFNTITPLTPEKAPNLAYTLLKVSGLAAGGLLGMAASWDLLHPFKDVIPGEIKAMLYDVTNFSKILGALTGAMFTVSIAQPMKYFYNARFRPYILSWSDVMELRSRGMMSDEDFIRHMYWHGYDDVLKPYFDELANTPLSYFMLRMIAEYGYWDEQFFKTEIQRMGYSKEAQQVLLESFKKAQMGIVQGMFGSYVVNRYIVGITTESELKAEAQQLGYTPGQIKQLWISAQLRDDYEYVKDVISALQYSLRRGYITMDEFRAQLQALGLRPEKVNEYVTIEQLRAKEDVGTTQEEEVRAYGRSTAIKRFKEGLTTENELEQELRIMGYSDQWIQRLKLVALLERDYDFAMTALSYVKSAWERGKIGDETFISILRQFGFTDAKIQLELSLLKLKKGVFLTEEGA